jgi:hypothetical protein
MMLKFIAIIGLLSLSYTSQAQVREVLFNSYPADSATSVTFNFQDSLIIYSWHNSAIFIETEVVMTGCPESLLKHAVAKGRYRVDADRADQTLTLKQSELSRAPINYPKGTCEELILHRVYLPTDFKTTDQLEWHRAEEVSKSTINY